jgi:hypothetical protein
MNFRLHKVKKFPDFTEPEGLQKPDTGIYPEPVCNLQPVLDRIDSTLSCA